MSVDHSSGVAAPKADPVFLHVKSSMTVIVIDEKTENQYVVGAVGVVVEA